VGRFGLAARSGVRVTTRSAMSNPATGCSEGRVFVAQQTVKPCAFEARSCHPPEQVFEVLGLEHDLVGAETVSAQQARYAPAKNMLRRGVVTIPRESTAIDGDRQAERGGRFG